MLKEKHNSVVEIYDIEPRNSEFMATLNSGNFIIYELTEKSIDIASIIKELTRVRI